MRTLHRHSWDDYTYIFFLFHSTFACSLLSAAFHFISFDENIYLQSHPIRDISSRDSAQANFEFDKSAWILRLLRYQIFIKIITIIIIKRAKRKQWRRCAKRKRKKTRGDSSRIASDDYFSSWMTGWCVNILEYCFRSFTTRLLYRWAWTCKGTG